MTPWLQSLDFGVFGNTEFGSGMPNVCTPYSFTARMHTPTPEKFGFTHRDPIPHE
jgi:hypothetical protein